MKYKLLGSSESHRPLVQNIGFKRLKTFIFNIMTNIPCCATKLNLKLKRNFFSFQHSSNASSPAWQASSPWNSNTSSGLRPQQSNNPWDTPQSDKPTNMWPPNRSSPVNHPTNQGAQAAQQSTNQSDDPWSSIAPVEARPKTWNNSSSTGRHTITPANRSEFFLFFYIICVIR